MRNLNLLRWLPIFSLALGCAARISPYAQWDTQIRALVYRGTREDVSLLVGTTPSHCDSVSTGSPTAGFTVVSSRVDGLLPGGPAEKAGLRVGYMVRDIAGYLPTNPATLNIVHNLAIRGTAFTVRTDSGTFTIVPEPLSGEQCYWDSDAGQVSKAGAAVVGRVGSAGASSYQKFYRLSARFVHGILAAYSSQWQQ